MRLIGCACVEIVVGGRSGRADGWAHENLNGPTCVNGRGVTHLGSKCASGCRMLHIWDVDAQMAVE